MITLPNGKICMNEQEAIQWLLDNYPIPFQCSADYAPETEIGLGTIVNPTPAKVKVGSIIFFADSKVSTVIGVNATSFKCSALYNDLVDDVVFVSNVQLNANGHLIVTLSNGTNIDAGLIKQVTNFSINSSQHLIATFNDGSSADLGAIFNGNITISGNLTVTGSINGEANPSLKPIYYHGIDMNSGNFDALITMTILDNANQAYNAARIIQWITNIVNNTGGLLIACNGNVRNYVDDDGNTRNGHVTAIFTNSSYLANNQIVITTVSDTGVKTSFTSNLTYFFSIFSNVGDKRNKLN